MEHCSKTSMFYNQMASGDIVISDPSINIT